MPHGEPMKRVGAGLLLAAVSGIVYGSMTVGAKAVDAPPLAKAAIATVLAAVALCWAIPRLRVDRKDWLKFGVMAATGGVLAPIFILYGLEYATALHAGLLLTVEMVATAGLAFLFLREKTTPRATAGLGALLAAAVCVALSSMGAAGGFADAGGVGGSSWLGIALVALAALAWAVDNVVSTHLTGDYRPPQLVVSKCVLATPVLVVAWLVVDPGTPATTNDWLLQAAIGIFGVGLGAVGFYFALRRIGAARTSAINVPVAGLAAAAGAWLFLHESIGWLDGVAMALIACGLFLLWEPNRRTGHAGTAGKTPKGS